MTASKNAAAALAVVLAGALASGSAAPPPHTESDADARFTALEHAYVVFSMRSFPVVATYLGGSAFDPSLADVDGKLRDNSPAAILAEDQQLRLLRNQFAQAEPRRLSARRRIDRLVAVAQIDFLLHQHEVLRHQQSAIDSYVEEPLRGIDWQIQGLKPGVTTRGTEAQWQQVLARTRAVPGYLATAQAQLAAGVRTGRAPDWRLLRDYGLNSTTADAEYFSKTLPGIAAQMMTGANREPLQRQLQQAGKDAAAAYQQLHDHIATTFFVDPAGQDAKALKPQFRADRFAMGEAEYDWALRNNLHVETTATALFNQSWPVLQARRAQMVALARTIAQAHHWLSVATSGGADALVSMVFEHLQENAPTTDAAMIDSYRKVGQRLVDYGRTTHLFDVPPQYRLDVTITPPPLRSSIQSAAYYPAPIFTPDGVGRFYVTPTGDDQQLLRELHNYDAEPDLAAHEGFPGHDWNYKIMSAWRAQISPVRWLTPGAVADSSSMWEDAITTEGWALYAEGLLAEPQNGAPHGFYTPEERLYELHGELLRDLRMRLDPGLHTGRISFEDAVSQFSAIIDFLPGSCRDPQALANPAKRASCDSARSEINRYTHWPIQAVTYRLGKDQILSLRHRAQRLFGPEFSEQRFHLEFMKQGTIPAGYFAEELLRNLSRPAS
ncbi:MAG: DUF885 domain-containing protein [Steroidobacteraceae bacterium]